MRWLRGLGALVVLGVVLVGAPFALLAWGRFPADLTSLTRPDDGTLLLAVLTVAGWLSWTAFAWPRWPRRSGSATGSTGRSGSRCSAGCSTQRGPAGRRPRPRPRSRGVAVPLQPPAAAAEPNPRRQNPLPRRGRREPPSRPAESYLVEPGDDLWTVSARLLGDGGRWRELVAANPELLHPTDRLTPGTRLRCPPRRGAHPDRHRGARRHPGEPRPGTSVQPAAGPGSPGPTGTWSPTPTTSRWAGGSPSREWRTPQGRAAASRSAARPTTPAGRTSLQRRSLRCSGGRLRPPRPPPGTGDPDPADRRVGNAPATVDPASDPACPCWSRSALWPPPRSSASSRPDGSSAEGAPGGPPAGPARRGARAGCAPPSACGRSPTGSPRSMPPCVRSDVTATRPASRCPNWNGWW